MLLFASKRVTESLIFLFFPKNLSRTDSQEVSSTIHWCPYPQRSDTRHLNTDTSGLCQNILHHVPVDIGKAVVTTLELVGIFLVVDT